MADRIERTLDFFEKGDDELAGQYVMENVQLPFLQELFDVPSDDPMYEVFPVSPEQAEALRPFVAGEIDIDRYDYYLDCFSIFQSSEDHLIDPRSTARSAVPKL